MYLVLYVPSAVFASCIALAALNAADRMFEIQSVMRTMYQAGLERSPWDIARLVRPFGRFFTEE